MKIKYLKQNGNVIASLEEGAIATVQDALDLIAEATYQDASGVVIPKKRLLKSSEKTSSMTVCAPPSPGIFPALTAKA